VLVVKINSIIICQTTIIHHILKKWNVYATRKILDPAIPIIAKECSVVLNNKARPPTRSELLAGVRNKDAVLCTLSDKIDQMVRMQLGLHLKSLALTAQELIIYIVLLGP